MPVAEDTEEDFLDVRDWEKEVNEFQAEVKKHRKEFENASARMQS